MITNADIKKLTKVFATREELDQKFAALTDVFYTKTEIDQKFEVIDKKFDKIDQKFDLIDQKFDKIDQKFDLIDQKFDQVDQRFNQVINGIDNLTKLYLAGNDEKTILGHRVDKMENWAEKVGSKVGIKMKH